MTQKQVVVTILDNEFKSQACVTIYYTNDETLEGSSCYELLELVQTHPILEQKVGGLGPKFAPPMTHKSGCGDGHI